MNDLPNYDTWKTQSFGRFEHAEERKAEAYTAALSERDSDLREDPDELDEALNEYLDDVETSKLWLAILQAAALRGPPSEIGAALTRLVQDAINAEARRYAEDETR